MLIRLLIFFLVLAFGYLVGSFVEASWNIRKWLIDTRILIAGLSIVGGILASLYDPAPQITSLYFNWPRIRK